MSPPGPPSLEQRVLLLAPTARDAETSRAILAHAGISSFVCKSLEETCAEMRRGGGVALLTQEAILSDKGHVLADTLRDQPPWSDFPLVVLTPAGVESPQAGLALEAIGHMTIVKRPVTIPTLVSTVRAALRDRARQYAARDYFVERGRQAEALREKDERLRATFAHSSVGMSLASLAGLFLEVNKAFCAITGYSEEELLRTDFVSITHPDDRERNADLTRRMLDGEIPGFGIEKRYARRDGGVVWVHDSVSVVRDAQGKPTNIVALTEDVTEKNLAESARRESEERYRTLAENVQHLFWTCLPDGRCDYLSSQWVRYTGINAEEQFGLNWLSLVIHPDDQSRALEAWMTAVADRGVYDLEYRIKGADGGYRWFKTRGTPIRGEQGNILKWFGTCTDIDDQKRAEAALRESERTYRFLAESMPQVVFTARPDGTLDYVNNVLAAYTGGRVEPGLGFSWSDLVHPDDLALTLDRWARCVATGERYEVEHRVRRADGVYRWFLVRALPRKDPDGRVLRWFGTSTDVEDMKQANKALLDADRRKDEFLAMLAHELRNPLAAVNNAVTVLKMSSLEENRAWASDVVERQVKQLARLIDDLLDVSRITSGKIRLRKEFIDAGPVLAQAVESVKPLIDERKHRLVTSLDRGALPLHADPTRLEQIVVNLLTNAAKYTESGGLIGLSASVEGDQVTIRVRDNGIGIPPERLPEMFQLFAQGERSIARSEGGLGIGLTIVQKLAEMHGGSISATSEGPGKGSEFTVRFPVATGPTRDPSAPTGASPRGAKKGSRILVVDDNVDTARGLARLLKLLGHDVQTAHDGPAALEAAESRPPEFVLLDIGLPGMDGYEVASRLRLQGRCKDAVIIAVSGYGQDEDRRRSREAGFDFHLVKPVDHDVLMTLISQPDAPGSQGL